MRIIFELKKSKSKTSYTEWNFSYRNCCTYKKNHTLGIDKDYEGYPLHDLLIPMYKIYIIIL